MDKRLTIFLLFPLLLFWHWFEPASKKNQDGIKAYQDQKYEEALGAFLSAKGIKPDMAELQNNTAASLYQLKKYQEALEEFSQIDPEKADIPKADFLYNLGNSYYRLNQFEKALESYKNSLLARSNDFDAKINYELTLKKIKEEKDKQDKKEENQDKEKEKQQQQQKQNPDKKHQNLMQYLNQNDKKQMEKKKRAVGIAKKEKDW